jgi:hypothetical protein
VQGEVPIAEPDGVAGVVSAVVAGDDVEPIREKVDELSFPLVSPLAAQDGENLHS